MSQDLYYLAASAVLTWVMLLAASLLRTHGWTMPGIKLACSNRDNLPDASPLAARADRAAKNMVENLVLFATLVLAAHVAGVIGPRVALGAQVFFYARLAYFAVYLAGVQYLRTTIWAVSVAGLGIILSALVA